MKTTLLILAIVCAPSVARAQELTAFLRAGRPDKGMPAFELSAQQSKDVAEFLHSSI